MASSDKLKIGKRVQARKVQGDQYAPGTIIEVNETRTGNWYLIRSKQLGTFKTRAACIK